MAKKENVIAELEAKIKPVLDVNELKKSLKDISNLSVKVGVKLDTKSFNDELNRLVTTSQGNRKNITLGVKLDTKAFNDAIASLPKKTITLGVKLDNKSYNDAVANLVKKTISLGVKADSKSFKESLNKLQNTSVTVGIKLDKKSFTDAIKNINANVPVGVKISTKSFREAVKALPEVKAKIGVKITATDFRKAVKESVDRITSNIKSMPTLSVQADYTALNTVEKKLSIIRALIRQINRMSVNVRGQVGVDSRKPTDSSQVGNRAGILGGSLVDDLTSVIHFWGRSSKGFGSFGEAVADMLSKLNMASGGFGALGVAITGATAVFATLAMGVSVVIKGIELFGNALGEIVNLVTTALKPGFELMAQRDSAMLTTKAALKTSAEIDGRKVTDEEAAAESTFLFNRAMKEAASTALNIQDVLAAQQGGLPLLLNKGMSPKEAQDVIFGVAGVAKLTRLAPNQVLQETRDLAQGSITARSSQVAQALNITNQDLAKYKGDVEGLTEFLNEKFKEYGDVMKEYVNTPIGALEQLQETWAMATSVICEQYGPLIVEMAHTITDSLGQFNEETGNFELSPWLSELAEGLKEIVVYAASCADSIYELIQEIVGGNDPIEVMINFIKDMVGMFTFLIETLLRVVEGFKVVWVAIRVGISIIESAAKAAWGFAQALRAIWVATSTGDMNSAFALFKESRDWLNESGQALLNATDLEGNWNDTIQTGWLGKNKKSGYDTFLGSGGGKFTQFVTNALDKAANREIPKGKDYDKMRGKDRDEEDEKARKKLVQESQKAMKARLAELKASLKDALDELKNILSKNKIAYEEGFMTLDEYLKAEAQASVDEASLKLEEAKAEREVIENALYSSEEDRNKALADNEKNINIYTRELKNAQLSYKEVSSKWVDSAKSVVKALDEFGRNISNLGKYGGAGGKNVKSASQVASALGVNEDVISDIIETAKKYNVDPRVALALANQESRFNQNVTSPAGAIGVMQLMPDTAAGLGVNPYNQHENIEGGVKYLAKQLETFSGDVRKALAAYNAGPEAVKKYGGIPPYAETQNYVSTIMSDIGNYEDKVSSIASDMTDKIGGLILSAAADQVEKGVPYVYGGATLDEGVDCSGLVYAIWNQLYGQAVEDLNTEFPRTADLQAVKMDKVGAFFDDANMLQIGDLVFFRGGDPGEMGIGHVGIYAGNNNFIEAQKTGTNVKYSNLADRSDIMGYGDVRKYFESLGLQVDRSGISAEAYKRLAASQTEKGHNRQKLIEEQTKELEEVLLKYGNSFVGNYREALYVAQVRHDREVKKVKNANLLKKEDLEARLQMIDELYQKEVLDIQASALEALADFNSNDIELKSDVSVKEIKEGSRNFSEYIDNIYNQVNTVNNDEKYWLGNQVEMLENLANAYEAKSYVVEAQKIREKVVALKKKPYEIAEKAINEVNEFFERQQSIFDATEGFTTLQKEFGERRLNASKAQANYEAYSELIVKVNDELSSTNQKLAKAQDILKSLVENTEDWKKAQADVNTLTTNKARLEVLQKEYEYQKKLNDLQRKQPEYLRDLKNTAREAFENGLLTFLTDGITEAESLKDALIDMARSFLKEIQQMSAKWFVEELSNKLFGAFKQDEQPKVSADSGVVGAVTSGSNAIVQAIHGLQYALTGTGQYSLGQNDSYVYANLTNDLNKPYQNSFTLSALQNSQFGENSGKANNYSFDYPSLCLTKFSEALNTATYSVPNLTDAVTATAQNITNSNVQVNIDKLGTSASNASISIENSVTKVSNYITTTLQFALESLATQAQNAANALMSISSNSSISALGGIDSASGEGFGFAHANGGYISGAGTGTSDSIPAMLSNGEFVLKSSAVAKYGVPFLNALNSGRYVRKFAEGGAVGISDEVIPTVPNTSSEKFNELVNVANEILGFMEKLENMGKIVSVFASLGTVYLPMIYNILSSINAKIVPSVGSAAGGYITGPGTSTSDSIPARLSRGEYVIKSSMVKRYGTNFLDSVNSGTFSMIKTKPMGYASGGLIGEATKDSINRGVSDFGKTVSNNINNTATINVALVRDEQEGMRQLLKSPEGQRIMLDFSRKYARVTSKF